MFFGGHSISHSLTIEPASLSGGNQKVRRSKPIGKKASAGSSTSLPREPKIGPRLEDPTGNHKVDTGAFFLVGTPFLLGF